MSFRKRRRGLAAPLLAALLAALLPVALAAAHALLLRSDPEDGARLEQGPPQVILWFSQELDSAYSTVQVVDSAGRQIDRGDGGIDLTDPDHASMTASLPASLPDGVYVVRWTAVSVDDGDLTEGEFAFSVGAAPAAGSQTIAANEVPVDDDAGRDHAEAEHREAGAAETPAGDNVVWPVRWIAAGALALFLLALGLFQRWGSRRAAGSRLDADRR